MGLDQRITLITYFEDYDNHDNFLSDLPVENTKIEVKHTFLLGTLRNNYLLAEEMCDECMKEREYDFEISFDDFQTFVEDFLFEDYFTEEDEEKREEKEEEIEELREILLKMEKVEKSVSNNDQIDRYEFIYESW